MFAAAAACVLWLGAVAEGEAQQQRVLSLNSLARQAAIQLDHGMAERVSQLTDVVASGDLRSLHHSPSIRELLERVKGSWAPYAWIGVTDAAGRVVAASGGLLEANDVSARPWFQHGCGGLFVGDVHEAALLASRLRGPEGEPLRFVDIALPLLDADGGLLGVLGAHIFWDWAKQVEQSVLSSSQEASGIELLIISVDDQVLLGPPGLQGTLLEPSLTAKVTHATQPSGSVREWPDGRFYLSTAVVAPGEGNFHGVGWTVVARQPLAHTTQNTRDVVLIALAAGACLFLLIGGVTWLLLRRARSSRGVGCAPLEVQQSQAASSRLSRDTPASVAWPPRRQQDPRQRGSH
ncbi:hypothetical protein EAH89_28645 [Roseomonas nepalensis]|uniref:Cache domain-containing protein n=1 Tax=Muricoccus nepalensis TaxID=1854500 RepID=A0A502EXU1_9PROT|nr:cache domain-containing protein [Roseomonas nepalensis]TPG41844.1 hypothetical protein EAH89_28645 [Roseomonas nepalensis]